MLTKEQNERFTRVGKGTAAGEMLRRYWWPVGFSDEVAAGAQPKAVRMLAEDVALFRDQRGQLGLLALHCSHRGASLAYGRVEGEALRCPYHGWVYDREGRCIEQPLEPEDSTYKDRIRHPAFVAREVGGLIFGYLGPLPAPEIPKYDLLHATDGERILGANHNNYNWLQDAEGSVDDGHLFALHAPAYPEIALMRPHLEWERKWYGVRRTAEVAGVYDTPRVWHSIFPCHTTMASARVGQPPNLYLRLRVPVDDVSSMTYYINFIPGRPPSQRVIGLRKSERGVYSRVDDGWWGIASQDQDRVVAETQGYIADRTSENLASTDGGILLWRRMLEESIAAVEDGEDPIGVVRDPNHALIEFDNSLDLMATSIAMR